MKRGFLTGLAVILIGWTAMTVAAQVQQPQDDPEGPSGPRVRVPTQVTTVKASRTPVKTVKVEVAVDKAARSDTPAFRGEGWFQQNCGLCHLGRWRKQGQLQAFAPSLAGVLKAASPEREAAVAPVHPARQREHAGLPERVHGSEFEELIAYLKTL